MLKEALTGPDVMAYPLNGGEFILDTDACDTGIGAVLSHIQGDRERVVAYASRTLNKAERNYCVTDKELMAVKHFVEYFHHYLMGRHFVVRSDHQALRWLFSLREPRGRIARWLELFSAYDFEIEYRKGTQHGNADAMSRGGVLFLGLSLNLGLRLNSVLLVCCFWFRTIFGLRIKF